MILHNFAAWPQQFFEKIKAWSWRSGRGAATGFFFSSFLLAFFSLKIRRLSQKLRRHAVWTSFPVVTAMLLPLSLLALFTASAPFSDNMVVFSPGLILLWHIGQTMFSSLTVLEEKETDYFIQLVCSVNSGTIQSEFNPSPPRRTNSAWIIHSRWHCTNEVEKQKLISALYQIRNIILNTISLNTSNQRSRIPVYYCIFSLRK